jgi:LPXTG-site transpeptidase (sortase) family protein
MSDERFARFSHNFPALTPFLFGWRFVLLSVWLVLVLIGAGNLLVRASGTTALSHNSLAVGPGFAVLDGNTSSTEATFIPARLVIPSIGVSAKIEQVGIGSDGSMQTPSSFSTVGWYKDGAAPGQPGNAVIDGHVNNALTSAGVFEHLDQLHLGDVIDVADASGKTLQFQVSSVQVYPVQNAPLDKIFTAKGAPGLALITCDGAWDQGKKEFDKRLVIFASLQVQK